MKKAILKNLITIPVIILGIVIIVVAIKQDSEFEKFYSDAKSVDATIDEVVSRRVRKGTGKKKKYRTEYDVYVTYTIDDTTYEHVEISTSGSSAVEGDKITLYYQPGNPKDVRDKEYQEGQMPTLIVIGSIIIAIGGGVLIVNLIKANSQAKLKQSGIRIEAEEICIDQNTKVKVNGRYPYIIYCRAYDPRIGAVKEFASKNCYEKLEKYDIRDVDIYLDPNNNKKHFVDVEGAIEMAKRGGRF